MFLFMTHIANVYELFYSFYYRRQCMHTRSYFYGYRDAARVITYHVLLRTLVL